VVPPGNITFTPTGTRRQLRVTPAANQFGTAVITLTARDNTGKSASDSFRLIISPVNDPPTIDPVSNITVSRNSAARTVSLTGISSGPSEGSLNQQVRMTISAKDKGSDANTLLDLDPNTPNVQNTFGPINNVGNTTSFTFIPLVNRVGVSVVTITLEDQQAANHTTTTTFEVTIQGGTDQPPTITSIPDAPPINVGGATPLLLFSVSDLETPANDLVVTATSSNTSLVPNNPANLILGGTGNNRSIQVKPASGASGQADVTVTVRDSAGQIANDTFHVTVISGPNPVISDIPDQNSPMNAVAEVRFTISDDQTPAQNLVVNVVSGNSAIVPNSSQNIQQGLDPLGGGPGNRLIVIRPAQNAIGSTVITVTVTDANQNTTTDTFTLNVQGNPPTISQIANQEIPVGGSTGPIPFTVNDTETFPSLLVVSPTSSNQTYIPLNNILLSGTGTNRTVTITPPAGTAGESTITLTVRDNEGQSASTTFRVTSPNSPPTISNIPDQAIATAGGSTPIINFTVSDPETFPELLAVTATSSNQSVVPNSNIALGGTGANRTIVVTGAPNQQGVAIISVAVSDGSKSSSDTFTVTIGSGAGNTRPTISSIPAQTTFVNTPTPVIQFTINDAETPTGSLNVNATSSNPTLIPNANILLGGAAGVRTIFVRPANNQVGNAGISVTVTDGGGLTASTSFLVTVLPTSSNAADFNSDGQSDLVYQDNAGFLAAWYMDGSVIKSSALFSPNNSGDPSWKVVGSGDFNADNKPDLLFQHTDGNLAVWYLNGVTLTSAVLVNPANPGDSRWRAVAIGDVNGDSKPDIIFQHTDGSLAAWYMNGINLVSGTLLNPSHPGDVNWKLVGAGQFNGDGKTDLAFQHTDGRLAAWYMNGVDLIAGNLLSPSSPGTANYRVLATPDQNSDGKSDLIFQHTDGSVAVWFLNGITLIRGEALTPAHPGGTWKVVGP
jgi:hypothetical protein